MFKLFPNQVEHVERVKRMLDEYHYAFDFSMLGTGKTYTSSHIALTDGYKNVVVVCPLSVAPKWAHMKRVYGVPIVDIISFCSLRSVKDKQPKHGLLKRIDFKKSIRKWNSKEKMYENVDYETVSFEPTPKLQTLVEEKTLFVIDEIQNFKNMSAQFESCKTLILCALNSQSRCILLSGSPIDKKEQAARLFKAINVFKADELSHMNLRTMTMEYTGLNEIETYCYGINYDMTRAIRDAYPWHLVGMNAYNYVYDLFQHVVKKKISSSMKPIKIEFELKKFNGFFHLGEPQLPTLMEGIQKLEEATGFDKDSGTVNLASTSRKDNTFGKITIALKTIEHAKVFMIARVAKQELESDPNKKVVICFNYKTSIKFMERALREFRPLVMTGETTVKQRTDILELFQAPNTSARVLIGNVAVCSTGIDLDDKHGLFPRTAFISPNYDTIGLYQLGHRFHRADSRSNATVYFVYAQERHEVSVLNALSRKSAIMKEVTPEQAEAGVVFPVDMPQFVEAL